MKKNEKKEVKKVEFKEKLSNAAGKAGEILKDVASDAVDMISVVAYVATPVCLVGAAASYLGFIMVDPITMLTAAGIAFGTYQLCKLAKHYLPKRDGIVTSVLKEVSQPIEQAA